MNLTTRAVTTLAGNGTKGNDYQGGGQGAEQVLNSPWDVTLVPSQPQVRQSAVDDIDSGPLVYCTMSACWFQAIFVQAEVIHKCKFSQAIHHHSPVQCAWAIHHHSPVQCACVVLLHEGHLTLASNLVRLCYE